MGDVINMFSYCKFKVGDIVVCVDASYSCSYPPLFENKRYKVVKVHDAHTIDVSDGVGILHTEVRTGRFEKLKDKDPSEGSTNFEILKKKNQENEERLKKERSKNNHSVTRSYRLKDKK